MQPALEQHFTLQCWYTQISHPVWWTLQKASGARTLVQHCKRDCRWPEWTRYAPRPWSLIFCVCIYIKSPFWIHKPPWCGEYPQSYARPGHKRTTQRGDRLCCLACSVLYIQMLQKLHTTHPLCLTQTPPISFHRSTLKRWSNTAMTWSMHTKPEKRKEPRLHR